MNDMRILVVDDEPVNRFVLLHLLDEEGYKHCYEARDGKEALKQVKFIKPDLLLLDIQMPELDGFEVARQVKSDYDAYVPIIFITASEDRESLVKCLEVGGDDFAVKPFDKVILSAKIRAHLRIRSMARRIEEQNKQLNAFQTDVNHEHKMVEHIYSHALKNPPTLDGFYELIQQPASTFNGDLFLAQPHPNGGIYMLLGDFTGHGLASTVGAIPVSQGFTSMAIQGFSVVEVASAINELLYTQLPIDRFLAATIIYIEKTGRRAMIWQGAMPDMYIQRTACKHLETVSSKHMALGILAPDEFETDCSIIDLNHDDVLYLVSDGLIEASPFDSVNEANINSMLGEDTIQNWLIETPGCSVNSLFSRAQNTLQRNTFDDDVTLVRFCAQDLSTFKSSQEISQVPFTFSISLGPDELRCDQSIEQALAVVCSQKGMVAARTDIFAVLSEMFTNALEHGVLKLDSCVKQTPDGFIDYYHQREQKLTDLKQGFINIDIHFKPDSRQMSIAVTDSGDGFDYQSPREMDNEACSGRGLMLLSEICQSVCFEGNGNRIIATLAV